MNEVDRHATTQDRAAVRVSTEVAYQAGVGSAELDDAVRRVDRCLFLLAADGQLPSGRTPSFAADLISEMVADLEQAALRMDAVSTRLTALGRQALSASSAAAAAP